MAERASNRLKKLREEAGYETAADFYKTFEDQGLTEGAYRHKENGTREINFNDAKLFARMLAKKIRWVNWIYILSGERPNRDVVATVIGYVGAGEQIFPFDDEHTWDPIPAPPGHSQDIRAAVVRGRSMHPVYRDGDVLFFSAEEAPAAEMIGRDCLVQEVEGRRLIKNLRRGSKRGLFRLYSYATDSESGDVRLEWAAPVSWVHRK